MSKKQRGLVLTWGLVARGGAVAVLLLWGITHSYLLLLDRPCADSAQVPDGVLKQVSDLQQELVLTRQRAERAEAQLKSHPSPGAAASAQTAAAVPSRALVASGLPVANVAAGFLAGASQSKCKPRCPGSEDAGYVDNFRGWYDVQGCGSCNDYCRWVGDCGPGGDPKTTREYSCSWWSCRLAGSHDAHSTRGLFTSWALPLCSGEGAPAPAGAAGQAGGPPVQVAASSAEVSASLQASEARVRSLAQNADAVAVVIIVCKRPQYLQRAMQSVLAAKRDPDRFPIIISQDDFDVAMTQMVDSTYVTPGIAHHVHHTHDPSAKVVAKKFGGSKATLGYVRIAQHFGWALRTVFDDLGFKQVIFIEEDMEISPDFFTFFGAMLPMMKADPDLFCVSAWNDNGYETQVMDPKEAFRTDFFPGLGWMVDSEFWGEVRDRWAEAYWDEFMRRKDVRRGRHCIRPDISRSFTFGDVGTSGGQFFKQHLSKIKMNDVVVDWASEDLTHLESAAAYDSHLQRRLQDARKATFDDMDNKFLTVGWATIKEVRVQYDDARDYKGMAKKYGLMPDEKEGIRRMSYRGVIPFAWKGKRVFLYTSKWPGDLD